MRRWVFVLFMAASEAALTLSHTTSASAGPAEAECSALASARLAGWKAAGLPSDEIDRRFRLAVVACASPAVDSVTAVFMGQMNFDYFRLATLLVNQTIGSGEYELRLRDRARKRGLARTSPGFLAEWMAGDADGDFVPDTRDQCPGTADLESTDNRGCSSSYRPPGYGPDPLVHDILDKMGVMRSPGCDGAPHTAMPTPLSMTFVAGGELHIVVSRPPNQPAGCEVFYEISADSPGWAPSQGRHYYSHVVLRDSESVGTDPDRVEFHLDWNSVGERLILMQHFVTSFHTTWRVRAVNGNGLASDYSRPLLSPY
jgi:hypothetical protein